MSAAVPWKSQLLSKQNSDVEEFDLIKWFFHKLSIFPPYNTHTIHLTARQEIKSCSCKICRAKALLTIDSSNFVNTFHIEIILTFYTWGNMFRLISNYQHLLPSSSPWTIGYAKDKFSFPTLLSKQKKRFTFSIHFYMPKPTNISKKSASG